MKNNENGAKTAVKKLFVFALLIAVSKLDFAVFALVMDASRLDFAVSAFVFAVFALFVAVCFTYSFTLSLK